MKDANVERTRKCIDAKWLKADSKSIATAVGLTFDESMQCLKDFQWGLTHAQGCAELTFTKRGKDGRFMQFYIHQLGKDIFFSDAYRGK
ncbi:hypothetical protein [Photobacterium nomapromontoriensis]|uniref:hypothetical protein n=1 Tax=Photobacterium nomapromontoriensis TaxID=2910237 RepID=UPI003D0A66A2